VYLFKLSNHALLPPQYDVSAVHLVQLVSKVGRLECLPSHSFIVQYYALIQRSNTTHYLQPTTRPTMCAAIYQSPSNRRRRPGLRTAPRTSRRSPAASVS
jgi:hypothetical protein